jgi:predicted adenine nucleotide alpha hydrolase (AANH) superfamily ATPase
VAYSTKKDSGNWIFLHSCCAPCSSAVLEQLKKYYHIILFFYNPNIMPAEEYEKRLAEQRRLASILDVELIEGEYDNTAFLKVVRGLESEPEKGRRCEACIRLRLEKTAKAAKTRGIDTFTTTLSVSPHKNAEMINKILVELSENALSEDFKKKDGYKRSLELSKEYGFYRQNYCGCVFEKNA